MKKTKGKQLIGLLICLIIGGGALGLGISRGVFTNAGSLFGEVHISKATLLTLVVMVFLVLAAEKALVLLLGLFKGRTHRTATVITITQSLLRYAAAIVILCWGLSIVGVNVSTILASVGVVALIVGFGAESLIEDVITGFFIIFEHQYDVGDIIVLDDFRGVVEKIGVRTTTIRDDGNNLKVVNNSDIRNFQNRSRKESVAVAIIGITYGQDVEEFERIVKENLPDVKAKYPEVFTGPIIYKGIEELADSSVNVKFTADCTEAQIFNAKRLLNREIKIMFDKNGIEIPFPQLDVHNIP